MTAPIYAAIAITAVALLAWDLTRTRRKGPPT